MRAICRLPGERMFNTRGAPGSPRVFTSAANTAAVTPATLRIIIRIIQRVSHMRAKAGLSAVAESRSRIVRVAISRRCATHAHGVNRNRRGGAIFQAELLYWRKKKNPSVIREPACGLLFFLRSTEIMRQVFH